MAVLVLMSIGDCFVPVAQVPDQLLGPKKELEGPCYVKRANPLCGVSFIASVPCKEGAKVYVRGRALLESEARECTT